MLKVLEQLLHKIKANRRREMIESAFEGVRTPDTASIISCGKPSPGISAKRVSFVFFAY